MIVHRLADHPAVTGTAGTLASATLAAAGEVAAAATRPHWLQQGAWAASIIVAAITIFVLLPKGIERWQRLRTPRGK